MFRRYILLHLLVLFGLLIVFGCSGSRGGVVPSDSESSGSHEQDGYDSGDGGVSNPTPAPTPSPTPAPPPPTGQTVTWDNTIAAMVQNSCGCHVSGSPAGIRLDTLAHAISSGAVVAGAPDSSRMYTAVKNGNMPYMNATQLQTVRDWIQNGAK